MCNIFVINDIEDMKTFKDLNFNIFKVGSKQAVMQFPNGYGVSVLSGNGSLSDNNHPYEIAVIMFDSCGTFAVVYPYYCNDDVLSSHSRQKKTLVPICNSFKDFIRKDIKKSHKLWDLMSMLKIWKIHFMHFN